jgi:hypothetical protein
VLVNYLLLPATTGRSATWQAAFRKAARLGRGRVQAELPPSPCAGPGLPAVSRIGIAAPIVPFLSCGLI